MYLGFSCLTHTRGIRACLFTLLVFPMHFSFFCRVCFFSYCRSMPAVPSTISFPVLFAVTFSLANTLHSSVCRTSY